MSSAEPKLWTLLDDSGQVPVFSEWSGRIEADKAHQSVASLALSHLRCTVKAVPADVSDTIGPNGTREMSNAAGAANSYSLPPQDRVAAELRGLSPCRHCCRQIVAPLGALVVLVCTRLSRTPWREIGYVRPKSWIGGLTTSSPSPTHCLATISIRFFGL